MEFITFNINKHNNYNRIKLLKIHLHPYKVKLASFGLTYEWRYITQHTA
jgi:hypothetical protein